MRFNSNIKKWLESWNQNNPPIKHHPYRIDDCLIVLGECTGIIVFPRTENYLKGKFSYEMLSEDDGQYRFCGGKWSYKDISWIREDIKCMEVVKEYIEKHASPMYYKGTKVQCGWQLPWKDK